MKIVIAGGSGLLGQALTEALIKAGDKVTILSRKPDEIDWQVPGSRVVAWISPSNASWEEEIDGSDVVINLAGASIAGDNLLNMRWTQARKEAILSSRHKAGQALVKAITQAERKPRTFLQASAIGYYGTQDEKNLTEASPPGQDFLAEVTRQWEASTVPLDNLSLRRVVLRTGLVLSRRGGLLPTLMVPFHFGAGGPVGSGRQIMSWIHIEDWVRAVIHLIKDESTQGVYNLTAPEAVGNRHFARALGKAMRRPALVRTPAWALKALLGEASTLALDGQHVIPSRLLDSKFTFEYESLESALTALFNEPLRFRRAFKVEATPSVVSDYHRNTAVLRRLTPFPIIVQFQHVEAVREGSTARFILWFGPVPVHWHARHYDVQMSQGFTDDLAAGPFRSWVHQHSFLSRPSGGTRVQDEIHAELGRGLFHGLVSRFMWLTLPILFAFRAWRTRRDVDRT